MTETKFLLGAGLGWIISYCGFSNLAIIAFASLLVFDFIIGIVDIYLTDRKSLKSSIASKGAIKKLTRFLTPFIVAVGIKVSAPLLGADYIADNALDVVSVALGILIASETYSIISHFYNINCGKNLPEVNGLEYIIGFLSNIFKFMKLKAPKE